VALGIPGARDRDDELTKARAALNWQRHFELSFDPELAKAETVTMIVQVNGKVRDRIEVDAAITEEDMEKVALASTRVQEHLGGRTPRNVIIVRPKLVNIVG